MSLAFLQSESLPDLSTFGIIAAAGVFLVLAAAAYIMFRMMRKTVKMAFRLTIVAIVLVIALVGSIAVYWKSGSNSKQARPKPLPTRTR